MKNIHLYIYACRVGYLSCLSFVDFKVIAGFEVEGNSGVRYALQVNSQHLLGHIIVVQLIIAQSHVHLQSEEVSAWKDHNSIQKKTLDCITN